MLHAFSRRPGLPYRSRHVCPSCDGYGRFGSPIAHVHWGAVFALKEICQSGRIGAMPPELTNELLQPQLSQLPNLLLTYQHIDPDLMIDPVSIFKLLFRDAPQFFADAHIQNILAECTEPIHRDCDHAGLYQVIYDVIFAYLNSFFNCPEFPLDRFATIASSGVLRKRAEFAVISMQFWRDWCLEELRKFEHDSFIQRYERALPDYCTAFAIDHNSDLHPWTPSGSWSRGAAFVKELLHYLYDLIGGTHDLISHSAFHRQFVRSFDREFSGR
jgi:hypothetical protein